MRRAAALVLTPVIAALALAGCSSSSSSSSSSAAASDSYKSVTVTGDFGKAPTVKIPKVKGSGDLYTKTLIQGTGATFTSTEGMVGNYVAYDWTGATSKQLGSSFTTGTPSLFVGSLLPGLETALKGAKIGSRVLAVIPPKDAFGTTGNSTEGIGATDTLVFVIDVNSTFPTTLTAAQTSNGGGALPTVTAPAAGSTAGPTVKINTKATPPTKLTVKTLTKGTGAVVKKGQDIAVQYNGLIWRTGASFQSSYTEDTPFTTPIGEGEVIPGWDTGLVGQTVGSRVMLVIPPAEGYGTAGASTVGIKGTDTLVFVVDILAAV
ncbi:MAG TPA: FKBP-type peptidyl-prolyl cis-trans isomerase [Trebonia sp.]|jgi:peptidylprolyl isomerase